jgi:hypothetical protein
MDLSDPQTLTLLIVVLAFLAGGGYLAYTLYSINSNSGGGGKVSSNYVKYAGKNPECDIAGGGCDVSPGLRVDTAADCQTMCDANRACEGFLYQRDGLTGNTNCWLKRFNSYPAAPAFGAPWEQADFYLQKASSN